MRTGYNDVTSKNGCPFMLVINNFQCTLKTLGEDDIFNYRESFTKFWEDIMRL